MSNHTFRAAVTEKGSRRVYHWASAVAFLLNILFVPMFLYPMGPKSHYSLEGTILAAIAGVLGCYGFFACPRRPIVSKLLTGLVCILSTVVAVDAVIQFIRFGHTA